MAIQKQKYKNVSKKMSYKLVQDGNCLFHLVHTKNLPSILKFGLLSLNEVKKRRIKHKSIAYENIQDRRKDTPIYCGNKGNLHDYVSLYFGARSPMLCALRYKFDQRDIIYIAVPWDILKEKSTVFTDGNAATHGTQQFDNIKNLKKVDLEAAAAWYWNDNSEIRRKKSAEVLVWNSITISKFKGFFVSNEKIREQVAEMLNAQNIKIEILIAPEFYYL